MGGNPCIPYGNAGISPCVPSPPTSRECTNTGHRPKLDACFVIHPPRHPPPRGTPWSQGTAEKKFPQEVNFFSSTATLVTPQPRIQKFLPAGDFFYPNPHCPHWAQRPPPLSPPPLAPPVAPPPPFAPPNPTPPPLLRRPHRNFVDAALATMAGRDQSHAPDPGANSRSAGFQAHGLFTCICTGAH